MDKYIISCDTATGNDYTITKVKITKEPIYKRFWQKMYNQSNRTIYMDVRPGFYTHSIDPSVFNVLYAGKERYCIILKSDHTGVNKKFIYQDRSLTINNDLTGTKTITYYNEELNVKLKMIHNDGVTI